MAIGIRRLNTFVRLLIFEQKLLWATERRRKEVKEMTGKSVPPKKQYERPLIQEVKLKPEEAVLSNCSPGEKMTSPWYPCLYTCNKDRS